MHGVSLLPRPRATAAAFAARLAAAATAAAHERRRRCQRSLPQAGRGAAEPATAKCTRIGRRVGVAVDCRARA